MDECSVYKRMYSGPPVCSVKDSSGKYSRDFSNALNPVIENITEMDRSLLTESLVLDKLVYKYVGAFRREKLLRSLRMVNKLVKRYLEVGVVRCMKEINGVLVDSDYKRLPSAAMVTHLFQQLLKGSKCLQGTIAICLHSYSLVKQKLHSAVFVPTMLIFSALLARVWYVSHGLLKELTDLYQPLIGQACRIWPSSEIGPDVPQCIRYLCPVYADIQGEKQNAFTSFAKTSEDENSAENQKEISPGLGPYPVAMETMSAMDTSLGFDSSSGNHAAGYEDIGEVLTRNVDISTESGDMCELTQTGNREIQQGMAEKRENDSNKTRDLQPERQKSARKKIVIKPGLKEFTLKVYSEKKTFKQLLKTLHSTGCVVIEYMNVETEFRTDACKTLRDELRSQNEKIKCVKSLQSRVKMARKAAKRLERKISKYINENDRSVTGGNNLNEYGNPNDHQLGFHNLSEIKIHSKSSRIEDSGLIDGLDEDIVKGDFLSIPIQQNMKGERQVHNVPIQETSSLDSENNNDKGDSNEDVINFKTETDESFGIMMDRVVICDDSTSNVKAESETNVKVESETNVKAESETNFKAESATNVKAEIETNVKAENETNQTSGVGNETETRRVEFFLDIPKKNKEQFVYKTLTDKQRRKDFIDKVKSGCHVLRCKKKIRKPKSGWFKSVLSLLKNLSKELKEREKAKVKTVRKYSSKLTDMIEYVLNDI